MKCDLKCKSSEGTFHNKNPDRGRTHLKRTFSVGALGVVNPSDSSLRKYTKFYIFSRSDDERHYSMKIGLFGQFGTFFSQVVFLHTFSLYFIFINQSTFVASIIKSRP